MKLVHLVQINWYAATNIKSQKTNNLMNLLMTEIYA